MPMTPIPPTAVPTLEAAVAHAAGGPVREVARVRRPGTRYYVARDGRVFSAAWVRGRPRVRHRVIGRTYQFAVTAEDEARRREKRPTSYDARDLYAEAWGRPHPHVAAAEREALLAELERQAAARREEQRRAQLERLDALRAEVAAPYYTAADLARESGLPRDTVTSAVRAGRTPRASTLTALLQARLTLLRRAG